MRNQGQIFVGTLIIVAGLVYLVGAIFSVDASALCLPIGLIVLGVFLLLRPQFIGPDTNLQLRLLGDVRRYGTWQVADEEIWIGVGDVRLDMTAAEIPEGETHIRVFGFVGSVRLSVPESVGVSLSSTSFVTDAKVLGQRYNRVLAPLHITSENYEAASHRIRLEVTRFVGELRISQTAA